MQNNKIKLSPSSINLFLECPCCFWLDKKMKIKRPAGFPYTLNSAMDYLLKREFDIYREKGENHPLFAEKGINVKLFPNQKLLNQWRSNMVGISYYDEALDAVLFGAVDDIIEFEDGSLAPLDYKSTGSKTANVYDRFQIQMDIYTFLLEKNGFRTKKKGYLAFYIVDKDIAFDNSSMSFRKELVEIDTNPDDVHKLFKDAVNLLRQKESPSHSRDCEFGNWLYKSKQFS